MCKKNLWHGPREGARSACLTLKNCLSRDFVLSYPDFSEPFVLVSDVSDSSTDGALKSLDDKRDPSAFLPQS